MMIQKVREAQTRWMGSSQKMTAMHHKVSLGVEESYHTLVVLKAMLSAYSFLDSIFEPGLVPCIHYTFPNAKDAKKM
jgi:hypothetical protein